MSKINNHINHFDKGREICEELSNYWKLLIIERKILQILKNVEVGSEKIWSSFKVYVDNLLDVWDKVFKNGASKICGRQPLKNLKGYGLIF